jgi:hypothetical protein
MSFDAATGTFSLPARSTAVFVMPQQGEEVVADEEMVEEETAMSEATEAHDEAIMEDDTHAESAQPTGPNNGLQYALIAVFIGFVFAGLVALFASRKKQP